MSRLLEARPITGAGSAVAVVDVHENVELPCARRAYLHHRCAPGSEKACRIRAADMEPDRFDGALPGNVDRLRVHAEASNFAMLMVARALLGVAIGGFWALATATVGNGGRIKPQGVEALNVAGSVKVTIERIE